MSNVKSSGELKEMSSIKTPPRRATNGNIENIGKHPNSDADPLATIDDSSTTALMNSEDSYPSDTISSLPSTLKDLSEKREVKDPDSHSHNRKLTAIFVFFTILDIILISLLVAVSVHLARLQQKNSSSSPGVNNDTNSTTPPPPPPALLEDSSFCLPCSQVYLNPIEVMQNQSQLSQRRDEWSGEGGHGATSPSPSPSPMLCCADPHDDLKKMVGDMFIRIHYERDRARGMVKLSNDTENSDEGDRPDVIQSHLLLRLDTEKAPIEVNGTHTVPLTLVKREAPTPDRRHQNASSSAHVVEGAIQIAHPGHFYINSQISFLFDRDQPVTQTQYVYRVRNGGQILLLENSAFPRDIRMQNSELSFVGGLFLLERGDKVVLRVSDYSYVDRETDMEFGLHRL
ncbi:hypothetical protein ACOMHN_014686 [Nucella lapillus]